jgi:hypothetical protein
MAFVVYNSATGETDFSMEVPPKGFVPAQGYSVLEVTELPVLLGAYRVKNDILVLNDIEPLKDQATASINEAVGLARLRFITDIPGQEMIYSIKESQARAFLAASPMPTELIPDYRMIASEVSARGISAYEAAQLIINLSAMWQLVGGALEDVRLAAIVAMAAAATPAEITAVQAKAQAAVQYILRQV